MKILHISDYHFSDNTTSKNLSEEIIRKLLDQLHQYEGKIDFIFFTGDLVYSGNNEKKFLEANNTLIRRLQKSLQVDQTNIFYCCGNHDINRKKVSNVLSKYFDKQISTNEKLNEFYEKKDQDYYSSLEPQKNYSTFIESLSYPKGDIVSDLFSIHKRKLSGNKLSIVSINTAWLSKDDSDYGSLLFPSAALEYIKEELEKEELKIILFHHPLPWLKGFNQEKIRTEVFSTFNLGFCGHHHQNVGSTHFIQNDGIFINQIQAVLTLESNKPIGASIVDYNFEENEKVRITPISYSPNHDSFLSESETEYTIPIGEKKKKQNILRDKITSKYKPTLEIANDLLLENDDSNDNQFLDLFTDPVIYSKIQGQLGDESISERIKLDEIKNAQNNTIILGPDKSGKTTILRKIQLDFLSSYSLNHIVPFYFDYKELEKNAGNSINFINIIRKYFEISKSSVNTLFEKNTFCFLIDNFENDHFITKELNVFLEDKSDNFFIVISSDQSSYKTLDGIGIGDLEFNKVYLHDLKRKDIRKYSKKWFNNNEETELSPLLDRINEICSQVELPFNYWTISLLLLLHKKTRFDANKNLFQILDSCIEEILNKQRLILQQKSLDYDLLRTICSEIAHKLLLDHKNTNYSATYSELFKFVENSINKNPRISADPKDIIKYLLKTGLLKEKENRYISFRLNGFFEFFLAKFLTRNNKFKNEILDNEQLYLSFKNELELYSGFRKDDESFLRRIFNKTKDSLINLNQVYEDLGTPDNILISKIHLVQGLKEAAIKLKDVRPLNESDKDLIFEEFETKEIQSEVHLKKIYNIDELTPDTAERYLSILGRVLRNSIEVQDYELQYQIFDYLLLGYINLGFFIIDKIEEDELFDEEIVGGKEIEILKLISNFVPTISQVSLHNSIGNHSMITMIKDRIEKLKEDISTNQYKVYMLLFLLLDIELEENMDYAESILEEINIGILKTSILLKLNYYLTFKGNESSKVESFLTEQIRITKRKMDSSSDSSETNKSIDKAKHSGLVRRNANK